MDIFPKTFPIFIQDRNVYVTGQIRTQDYSEFGFLLGQIKIWSTKKLKYNRERDIENILKYKNPKI